MYIHILWFYIFKHILIKIVYIIQSLLMQLLSPGCHNHWKAFKKANPLSAADVQCSDFPRNESRKPCNFGKFPSFSYLWEILRHTYFYSKF